jgi:membrane protein YqaA with SNARE-associated domain
MDVLTIVLSGRKQELWLYYALMATIGSLTGGYLTYRLARKGGNARTQVSAWTLERVHRIFGRRGFGAIAIAALLPRRCPWFHFSLLQAKCNIPWENSWLR